MMSLQTELKIALARLYKEAAPAALKNRPQVTASRSRHSGNRQSPEFVRHSQSVELSSFGGYGSPMAPPP
jgi:hypothetical protein